MIWTVFSIGKPRLGYARDGMEEYARRLKGGAFTLRHEPLKASGREAEGALLLKRSEGMFRVALDERGRMWKSREFAAEVTRWEMDGIRQVALLIGGADGHSPAVRQAANLCWSLSPLTLQHELALVVLYEQIYRAATLRAGLPYHRD